MRRVVLISGSLGYLGGRIAQVLARDPKLELRLGTRRPTLSRPDWLDTGEPIRMELMEAESLAAACAGVDCVVHLAAMNEIDSALDPERALLVNGLGTLRLLRAAEHAGVERFVYLSTAHVYGAPLVGTITEESLPRPAHPYSITHRTAEDFVISAHDRKALTGLVVRLSNGFGAPTHAEVDRWTLLVNDLCRQAVQSGKLLLRSSGLQQRDFVTLHDVGRGVRHLLDLPRAACGSAIFNLGGENPLRVIDLAQRIAARCTAVLGVTPPIERPEPSAGESTEYLDYRVDRLKETGFRLEGDFDAEIDATLLLCRDAFRRAG